MSVAINAKNRLDGANEVTDLGGDLVMSKDLDQGQTQANATNADAMETTRNTFGSNGNVLITFASITTPTEKSTLIIVVASSTFIAGVNLSKNWLLKRGATTIDTFSLESADTNSQNTDIRLYTNSSPVVGTHTYTLVEDDPNTFGGIVAQLFFIKGTDTHAVNVVTPDTHDTKESGVSAN